MLILLSDRFRLTATTHHGNHHSFICIYDGLGNVVAVWSLHVSVLKNHELFGTGGKGATFDIPLQAFAREKNWPIDTRRWRCVVSRFYGIEDGWRTDMPQVDSTRPDGISIKLKDIPMLESRHCQIRLIDAETGLCFQAIRLVQHAEADFKRTPSLIRLPSVKDAVEEDSLPDTVKPDTVIDEDDIDQDVEVEESVLEPETQGEVIFYLLVSAEWMRSHVRIKRKEKKRAEIRIRVNASEVLREDLRDIEELKRLAGEDEEVLKPEWDDVRKKLKSETGCEAFQYSLRPGAQSTVDSERDLLLLTRGWMKMLRTTGLDCVIIQPFSPESDFELIEVQRRARFADELAEEHWLTCAALGASVDRFLSCRHGSLGAFSSSGIRREGQQAEFVVSGVLLRSYDSEVTGFPGKAGAAEIRVGDKSVVISKCQPTSKMRRSIYGRKVRVVVLESLDVDGQELPLCEVNIPVLPDGSSATAWDDFRSMVASSAGQGVDTARFCYVPAASTRSTCAPWCIKTQPETHISHVEDEIEQGISAYGIKSRLLRLERISRHVDGAKGREGHPVVVELTLLHEEMSIYQNQAKREKFCKLLEEAISQCVKPKVKTPKTDEKKDTSKKGKFDEANVLTAGQCEIADAIELKDASIDGVWLAVRRGSESPLHAKAFVAELQSPSVIRALEDAITTMSSNTPEEKLRRASFPKSGPVLARLNCMTPAFCSIEAVQKELAMLRALIAGDQSQFEMFRWKGLTLRYKGLHPWARRHEKDHGKAPPYYYLDHDTERILYASSGVVYIEDQIDFKEAVQNIVHREAFASTGIAPSVCTASTSVPGLMMPLSLLFGDV